jgi:hypothetical protein
MECPVCNGAGEVDDTVLYAELAYTGFGEVFAMQYSEPAEWWVSDNCPWGMDILAKKNKGIICDTCGWRVCENRKCSDGVVKCQICGGSGKLIKECVRT